MDIKLSIKQSFLDLILSGEKTIEYRDCSDFYITRLCVLNGKGEFKSWKPIKSVTFTVQRKKAAPKHRFAVRRLAFEEWLDEKTGAPTGEFTFAIYLGKKLEIPE